MHFCDTYSKGFMIDDFKFTCAGCGVSVELVGLRVELTTMMLERDKANAYASHVCGQNLDLNGINHELRAMIASYREALDLIAAPERPDGTYNRDRKACEQIARAALSKHVTADDTSEKPVAEIVKERHDSDDDKPHCSWCASFLKVDAPVPQTRQDDTTSCKHHEWQEFGSGQECRKCKTTRTMPASDDDQWGPTSTCSNAQCGINWEPRKGKYMSLCPECGSQPMEASKESTDGK